MKAFGRHIAIVAALLVVASAARARSDASGYPSFCAIPATPTGVRSAAQFEDAVVGVRLSGRDLKRRTAPAAWSLENGEAFAAEARAEAAPPPPIGTPDDAAAFAAAARAAVKPPRR